MLIHVRNVARIGPTVMAIASEILSWSKLVYIMSSLMMIMERGRQRYVSG